MYSGVEFDSISREDQAVPNRRDFFKTITGAAAGAYVVGRGGAVSGQAPPARRQVSIAGKRVRVVDVHAHCDMPLGDVVKGTPFENQANADPELEERIPSMDKAGRRPAGAQHQWLLVVRGQGPGPRPCHLQRAERRTGQVGASPPGSLRGHGVRPVAVSRSRRGDAAGSRHQVWGQGASHSAGTSTARTSRCRSSIRSGPRRRR